jgi:hypothetical protein
MPDNYGKMTSSEAPQKLQDFSFSMLPHVSWIRLTGPTIKPDTSLSIGTMGLPLRSDCKSTYPVLVKELKDETNTVSR